MLRKVAANDIFLGDAKEATGGRMSRSANRNATPRAFDNRPLQEFFRTRFKRGDVVFVEFRVAALDEDWWAGSRCADDNSSERAASPQRTGAPQKREC